MLKNPSRAACYVRVSTEEQTDFSPDAQLRVIKDYASKHQLLIDDLHIYVDEGLSARTDNRPEFQRMIRDAKRKPRPFDVILVHKFDRFSRNREDSIVYKNLLRKQCGIDVISISEPLDDSPVSKLLEGMLEVIAEFYSLNLAHEAKKGMTEKALAGGFLARPPYGYEVVEKGEPPVVIPEQAEVVQLIFRKKLERWSYFKIVNYLNNKLMVSMPTGPFSVTRVKYILANPFYCGILRWNVRDSTSGNVFRDEEEWIEVPGLHEPIISKEVFYDVQRLIEQKKNLGGNRMPPERYAHYLSGLIRCSYCGGVLAHNYRKAGSRFVCDNYSKAVCAHSNSISVRKMEVAIVDRLKLDTQKAGEIIMAKPPDHPSLELTITQRQLERIPEKRERIKNAYTAGIDSLEEYRENKNKLLSEEKQLKTLISFLSEREKPEEEKIKKSLATLCEALQLDHLSMEEKRLMVHSVIKEIVFKRTDRQNATITVVYNWMG